MPLPDFFVGSDIYFSLCYPFFRVPFTYILAIVLIVYMYFRLLSRNYYKRQQENNFFI